VRQSASASGRSQEPGWHATTETHRRPVRAPIGDVN